MIASRVLACDYKRLKEVLQDHEPKTGEVDGKGVTEIWIWDETGTFRMVYVLHYFQKKTENTPQEAASMKARSSLMMKLTAVIQERYDPGRSRGAVRRDSAQGFPT
jgi:phage-related protein